jgi:hypothetical protein
MRVPDSHLPQGLASAAQSSTRNHAILPIIQKVQSGPDVLFFVHLTSLLFILASVDGECGCDRQKMGLRGRI